MNNRASGTQHSGLDEALAQYAKPVEPSAELKESILSQLDNHPQQVSAKSNVAEMVELGDRRKAKTDGGFQRGWMGLTAVAAALVLVAGVGVVVAWPDGADRAGREAVVSADRSQTSGAEQLHEIMEARDAVSATFTADGARLDVAVSEDKDKGGAMVNGTPKLDRGMGAQVWSIDRAGRVRSAGVIGQEPHEDVWMPLPADTMAVKVTVEPMAGAQAPSGEVLASVEL
ncbi:MAG: anti-sigma factor [Corynebacterium sp.]|uniref:anti-sigma factor n=1 Tax=Corynebacterium sp. TaxID=1720 RepID=UPI0026DD1301|nr:anti-sigma factor [Corynebacterium sp.]MDO5030603.1 anti-sigma factor [Corynebacterium sp.]